MALHEPRTLLQAVPRHHTVGELQKTLLEHALTVIAVDDGLIEGHPHILDLDGLCELQAHPLQGVAHAADVTVKLGQIAAEATLDNLPYYRRNFARIIATRQKLSDQLAKFGFTVLPSDTNFILVIVQNNSICIPN